MKSDCMYAFYLSIFLSACLISPHALSDTILINPKTGYSYANNEVLVRFKAGTSNNRIQEIAESVDGAIPEFAPSLDYHFVVFHRTFSEYSELIDVVNKIRQYPEVIEAQPSPVFYDF